MTKSPTEGTKRYTPLKKRSNAFGRREAWGRPKRDMRGVPELMLFLARMALALGVDSKKKFLRLLGQTITPKNYGKFWDPASEVTPTIALLSGAAEMVGCRIMLVPEHGVQVVELIQEEAIDMASDGKIRLTPGHILEADVELLPKTRAMLDRLRAIVEAKQKGAQDG